VSRGFPAIVLAVAAGTAGFPSVSLRAALAPALALVLLFVPYLFYGVTRARTPRALAWVAALLVPYLLYALGTRTFDCLALARLGAYAAFRQGGNLMPAALVHTLVDAVWVAFFR
jgi:hypothetical protein